MEYMNLDGHVFSRSASTPPVLNSNIATQIGIKVPCVFEPGQYSGPFVGSNVKLRLVVEDGRRKMTCHARVDWVETDPGTGASTVGFGSLSLTEEEFRLLKKSFTTEPKEPLRFGVSVRSMAADAETVKVSEQAREIMRLKAVNFPISVIEEIDENRGELTFSDFVSTAVRDYIKRMPER